MDKYSAAVCIWQDWKERWFINDNFSESYGLKCADKQYDYFYECPLAS